MKTIITTYIPATNTKGSRIRAKAEGVPSITIPYDYSQCNTDDQHAVAAIKLANKYGWKGELVSGSDNKHCYFNFLDSSKFLIS